MEDQCREMLEMIFPAKPLDRGAEEEYNLHNNTDVSKDVGKENTMKSMKSRLLTALFCLCLCAAVTVLCPIRAHADDPIYVNKVLTTTTYTPVALMDLDYVTAATSTSGVYITEYNWFDVETGSVITSNFTTRPAEVQITLATYDGIEFSDTVAVYLNNSPASFVVSADHRYLTLSRTYAPDVWKPSVIKNPENETVEEGGIASFAATAIYNLGYQWMVLDPETWEHYPVDELPDRYGVTVGETGNDHVTIYGVTREMDGLRFYCTFLGAVKGDYYNADSLGATLHVRFDPNAVITEPEPEEEPAEEVPAEEPTETPEETPAEETGAEETGPAPAETEAEEVHTHVFSDTWSYDGSTHWRECECGERTEQGAHTLEWKLTRRATKKIAGIETGTCTTCGYTVTRETDYDGISDGLRLAIVGVAGLTALTILVLIVDSIRTSIKRRKRRKKKRSASHVKK